MLSEGGKCQCEVVNNRLRITPFAWARGEDRIKVTLRRGGKSSSGYIGIIIEPPPETGKSWFASPIPTGYRTQTMLYQDRTGSLTEEWIKDNATTRHEGGLFAYRLSVGMFKGRACYRDPVQAGKQVAPIAFEAPFVKVPRGTKALLYRCRGFLEQHPGKPGKYVHAEWDRGLRGFDYALDKPSATSGASGGGANWMHPRDGSISSLLSRQGQQPHFSDKTGKQDGIGFGDTADPTTKPGADYPTGRWFEMDLLVVANDGYSYRIDGVEVLKKRGVKPIVDGSTSFNQARWVHRHSNGGETQKSENFAPADASFYWCDFEILALS